MVVIEVKDWKFLAPVRRANGGPRIAEKQTSINSARSVPENSSLTVTQRPPTFCSSRKVLQNGYDGVQDVLTAATTLGDVNPSIRNMHPGLASRVTDLRDGERRSDKSARWFPLGQGHPQVDERFFGVTQESLRKSRKAGSRPREGRGRGGQGAGRVVEIQDRD